MTNRDALRLALEALESCTPADYSTGHIIHQSYNEDLVNKAIEAIAALSAQVEANQQDARDAELYKWLRPRFIGYDFQWGDPQTVVAVFEVGDKFVGGRDIDLAIRNAIQSTKGEGS